MDPGTHNVIIFTDLDGTLLDHNNYSFTEAQPALDKIKQLGIPLILNSSKTLTEIIDLRTKLDNQHPFIIENGATIIIPKNYFPGFDQPFNKVLLGIGRDEFLPVIHKLRRKNNFQFKGFSDFSINQICQETGLSPEQAQKASERTGTEPVIWLGDTQSLKNFQIALKRNNLKFVKGGRFLHIMGQTDKSKAMAWLIDQYCKKFRRNIPLIIALGDSQNDKIMLENADIAAVLPDRDGIHMDLTSRTKQTVIYCRHQAPAGWQEAMDQIFNGIITQGAT